MTRVLIMTTAVGYNGDQFAPFLKSLQNVNFSGKLVVLADTPTVQALSPYMPVNSEFIVVDKEDTMKVLNEAKPELIELVKTGMNVVSEPFMQRAMEVDLDWTIRFNTTFAHPSVYRYAKYYQYLLDKQDQFDAVILCDSRDVIFQRDPAEVMTPNMKIHFGLEYQSSRLGHDEFNVGWIRHLYGEEGMKRWHSNRISCSGATIGGIQPILHYIKMLMTELLLKSMKTAQEYGFDQGVHNTFWWEDKIPDLVMTENYYGDVINMAFEPIDLMVKQSKDGFIRRIDNGEKIMLVHQYDRYADLIANLHKQFA